MEYQMYTCHHCAYETPSLELMLKHQAEKHPKPEVTYNAALTGRGDGK